MKTHLLATATVALCAFILASAVAATPAKSSPSKAQQHLEPYIYQLAGPSSEPLLATYRILKPIQIKSVSIKGIKTSFTSYTVLGRRYLELTYKPRPGQDIEFDQLLVNGHHELIGPNRIINTDAAEPIALERTMYSPFEGIEFEGRFFNTSDLGPKPQSLTVLGVDYGAKATRFQTTLSNLKGQNRTSLNLAPSHGFHIWVDAPNCQANSKVRALINPVIRYRTADSATVKRLALDFVFTEACLKTQASNN